MANPDHVAARWSSVENTGTRIDWRFGKRRELWMETGEAGFSVADDSARLMLVCLGRFRGSDRGGP